ncbi:MAG: HNH endonuclease [Pyrinomonadaceae bacterium]
MCEQPSNASDRQHGDATFEAHHVLPIAMSAARVTRLSELALLCANCHRLLHRGIAERQRWLTIAEGKTLLAGEGRYAINSEQLTG